MTLVLRRLKEGVSLATVIMISFLLKDSSDGLDAVLVQMIKEIRYKLQSNNSKINPKEFKKGFDLDDQ
jgi:hypothetical protein